MAVQLKVWFDAEADILEVQLSDKAGYMRETGNHSILERVDEEGNVIGFSIMGGSRLDRPLVADLGANAG